MVTPSVRLARRLGVGGMGSVWLADHNTLKTSVVVKFIANELSQDEQALSRFAREAAAASQVKSPHVVKMLDHGVSSDGTPYIVMEHLEGHDLGAHIEKYGRMDSTAVVEVINQVSRALVRAHESGIVHRDIKPSNIFLCDAGDGQLFVKLLDFGIAKGVEGNLMDSKTRTGSLLGSPHYMSPEQVVGGKCDARTDLWSLGVVAFEALTGVKPFEADTIGGLALKIHHEALPLPTQFNGNLPKAVDAWFSKACAKDPNARFSTAKELAEALALAVRGEIAPGISVTTGSDMRSPEEAFAKTTLDQTASRPRTGLFVAIGVGVLAIGALAMIAVPRLLGPSVPAPTAVPLAPSTTVPTQTTVVLPEPVLSTIPSTTAVPSLHPTAKPSTIVRAPLPSAAATAPSAATSTQPPPSITAPVPSHDTYDIK
jgi:serine/threonine-protein kinase